METILPIDTRERIPHSSLPWVWFGFIFSFFFLIGETLVVFMELEESFNIALILISVAGWIYWLFCVYRFHRILDEITLGRYPISAGQAAGLHIIPLFNFYWIFKWSVTLSRYLNERGRVNIVSGYVMGFLILVSVLLVRFVDGAIGLACMFGVLMYVASKLRKHVAELQGPMLPPPPPDSSTLRDENRERVKRRETFQTASPPDVRRLALPRRIARVSIWAPAF